MQVMQVVRLTQIAINVEPQQKNHIGMISNTRKPLSVDFDMYHNRMNRERNYLIP